MAAEFQHYQQKWRYNVLRMTESRLPKKLMNYQIMDAEALTELVTFRTVSSIRSSERGNKPRCLSKENVRLKLRLTDRTFTAGA